MEPLTRFEVRYQNQLMAIELAIIDTYRKHRTMNDWDAQEAVVGLIRTYQAEHDGVSTPTLRFHPTGEIAYDKAHAACEWLLGRQEGDDAMKAVKKSEPTKLEEVIDCLKHIRRSIERWQKEGGRTTYLDFVSRFLPAVIRR